MARPDDIYHVQVMVSDEEVEMGPHEDQSGTCSPMTLKVSTRNDKIGQTTHQAIEVSHPLASDPE